MKKLSTSNYQPSTVRGFTLIETFVAITILVTAIVGPLTLAAKGLTSAMVARDQLTASFLAQEGIEFIRQKRDTNTLQGITPWLTGLEECIDKNCIVDAVTDSDPVECPANICEVMRIDENSYFYGYDAADPISIFTRSVKIEPLPSGYEAKITSTVAWRTGIFVRQIVLSEVITDWQ